MNFEGQVIAERYHLTRLIAHGGMGALYEARNTATYKRCAVKLLVASEPGPSEKDLRRFILESRTSSVIESDHVVNVFDAGIDGVTGTPYIVMELLRGEDLRSLIRRLRIPNPELAAKIVLQAAMGLAKAHARGIIHRDIKPANLFLTVRDTGDHVVKIIDFGIAKVKMERFAESGEGLTRSGGIVGTPVYMSPEQARGARDVNARTDVWSLGIVMFELLSGALPYRDTSSLGSIMEAIFTQELPDIEDKAPWVPAELCHIARRALRRDAALRYRDAAELRDALSHALGSDARINAELVSSLRAELLEKSPGSAQVARIEAAHTPKGNSAQSVAPSSRTQDGFPRIASIVLGLAFGGGVIGFGSYAFWPEATTTAESAQPAKASTAGLVAPLEPNVTAETLPVSASPQHADASVEAGAVDLSDGAASASDQTRASKLVRPRSDAPRASQASTPAQQQPAVPPPSPSTHTQPSILPPSVATAKRTPAADLSDSMDEFR